MIFSRWKIEVSIPAFAIDLMRMSWSSQFVLFSSCSKRVCRTRKIS